MRLAAAIVAISIGVAVVFFGIREARTARVHGPDAAIDQFVAAFTQGDSAAMAAMLSADSRADRSQLPDTPLENVRFTIKPAQADERSAVADVTFLSDGNFLRGHVFAVRENEQWRILGLRLAEPPEVEPSTAALTRLRESSGVTVDSISSKVGK